jgi:hypothetical protein
MILAQQTGWLVSQVGDEVLMLNIDRGEYVGLNPSGAAIWELLETPKTVRALVDDLVTQFDVTRDQATADVDAFVETALQRGVLVEVPEARE